MGHTSTLKHLKPYVI
jgi:hypothetical protein